LNTCAGKILGLKLIGEDFAFSVANGSGLVHLEAAHGGGGAPLLLRVIAAVNVERVLRFAGDIHLLLLLLRHCSPETKREISWFLTLSVSTAVWI